MSVAALADNRGDIPAVEVDAEQIINGFCGICPRVLNRPPVALFQCAITQGIDLKAGGSMENYERE